MPPVTVAIVLVAAVAHAGWNLVSKYKKGDTLLFVGAYTTASAILCLPLTIGAAVSGSQPITWALVAAAAVSAALHLTYSLTLQAGYDRADLGVVYPIARGVGPLLTIVIAIFLLGERPTALAIIGALVILAGILVVTGNPFQRTGSRPLRGIAWGILPPEPRSPPTRCGTRSRSAPSGSHPSVTTPARSSSRSYSWLQPSSDAAQRSRTPSA